jgi:putative transposase
MGRTYPGHADRVRDHSERTPYPSDLTDAEWKILEPLLLPKSKRGRPRQTPLREIVDAIRYIARTGCQWRYLPHDFPDWRLVAKTFYRWVKAGTWEEVNTALREKVRVAAGRTPRPTAAIIDSQSVKTTEKGGLEDSTEARRSTVANATFS